MLVCARLRAAALTQLQHLSLGYVFGGVSEADLNAILRHCPLRSLALRYNPIDLSAVDWAACSGALVSLQLWREDLIQGPLPLEKLPIANAILPALKHLSIDELLLMNKGGVDSVAGVTAGITAAVAASPDLHVEVGELGIKNMMAAEVLEELSPLQNRIHVREELRCDNVLFGSPHEVAAMTRLLPCRSVDLSR